MSVRNLIARSALVNQLQTSKNVSKSTSFSVTWVDDRCRDLSNDTFVVHIRRVFISYDCINLWNVRKHFRIRISNEVFTTYCCRETNQFRFRRYCCIAPCANCVHITVYLKRSFCDLRLRRNKLLSVSSLLSHWIKCELCTDHFVFKTKFLRIIVAEE